MDWIEEMFDINYRELNQIMVKIGTNILISVLILFLGFWLSRVFSNGVKKILHKSKTDEGLITFTASLLSILMKLLVVVTAITQLGIQMTSFVALLGAVGLAIGMAFSGTLSNFAGGVMILVLKPFKVGDLIMAQNEQGVVKEIHIFNTYLYTTDNKVIVFPNGPLANGTIINYTKAKNRRVDWVFSISYGDDFLKAKKVLEQFIQEDQRILKDQEHFIGLSTLSNSSIDLVVRVWVKTDDYYPVFYDMNQRVYLAFNQEGLTFPYPKMDVYLKNENNV